MDELDEAHDFTLRKPLEVARIVDKLIETDDALRAKVAAMFAIVLADSLGTFKTERRLNHFQYTSEVVRDQVKTFYVTEKNAKPD